jgi:hypothetical protein
MQQHLREEPVSSGPEGTARTDMACRSNGRSLQLAGYYRYGEQAVFNVLALILLRGLDLSGAAWTSRFQCACTPCLSFRLAALHVRAF